MRTLILGGTHFIGRHIAETLLAAGHRVTVFNRGRSPDELPAGVERLRGDRDAGPEGLGALDGRTWDACVDVCGYTARQVRPSAERLRYRIGRYVYISAVSAYGDPVERPVRETHPLQPPASEDVTEVNGETYGALKVTCENLVREVYPNRYTVLRPQIVAGPHDPSGRYPYWVQRAMRGGEMLAPGNGSDHVQVIDVRDLARFTQRALEQGLDGSFTFHEQLPLYRPERGPRSSLMDVSHEKARAAGLTLTDPEVTARDTRAWLVGHELTPALSPELESELIRRARETG